MAMFRSVMVQTDGHFVKAGVQIQIFAKAQVLQYTVTSVATLEYKIKCVTRTVVHSIWKDLCWLGWMLIEQRDAYTGKQDNTWL